MENSIVKVEIWYKKNCVLNESSEPFNEKDIKHLIKALKDTQHKTNECLTKLIEETSSEFQVSAELEKSELSEDDSTDNETDDFNNTIDLTTTITKKLADDDDGENDVSPKRAKLKKLYEN